MEEVANFWFICSFNILLIWSWITNKLKFAANTFIIVVFNCKEIEIKLSNRLNYYKEKVEFAKEKSFAIYFELFKYL